MTRVRVRQLVAIFGGIISMMTIADLGYAQGARRSAAVFRIPKALVGSAEKLIRQNAGAESDGLAVIESVDHLSTLVDESKLEIIRSIDGLVVDPRLPEHRRVVAPWVNDFLEDLVRDFTQEFPKARPLQLNSAARDLPFQEYLTGRTRRGGQRNPNAAPTSGEKTSAHLRGAAVDISHLRLSVAEKRWLADHLEVLQAEGLLDATVERRQAVFHVTVFKSYSQARISNDVLAEAQTVAPNEGAFDCELPM